MMRLVFRNFLRFRQEKYWLSKLLGSLQSPITNLARVLNQIAEQGDAPAEAEAEAPAAE